MKLKRFWLAPVLLALTLVAAACFSINSIGLIDGIVTAAEGVIAVISPADAAIATPYISAVLSITDTVSACKLTAPCIAQAVTDLSALQLPVSPGIQSILSGLTKAIAAILKAFPPPPTPVVVAGKMKAANIKALSPSDQAKLDAIRNRIKVAEDALANKRAARR